MPALGRKRKGRIDQMIKRILIFAIVTILVMIAYGIVLEDVLGQTRPRQPIPTYTFEIRGVEANDFSVSIEGKYTRPDGKVTEIENHEAPLPVNLYVNADCSVDLKITTTEKRFRATVFYEHQDKMKWVATVDGIAGVGASVKLQPYRE